MKIAFINGYYYIVKNGKVQWEVQYVSDTEAREAIQEEE